MEPWRTPAKIFPQTVKLESVLVICLRFEVVSMPIVQDHRHETLLSKGPWFKHSKALDRSVNSAPKAAFLSSTACFQN